MKRILPILAILFIALSSCSSDDDSSSNSQIQINPPNWIQGKWLLEGSLVGESGWRFTNNDFIIIQVNTEISQREQLQQFADNGQNVSASDTSTDDTYSVTLNSLGGQSTTYSFTQISDNEISWDSVSSSIFIKQ
ncbi:hypothetical protein G1K73_12700 [Tenacibaculum finnmarkense]|uniref:hypothetical protein n=1 Tax=Tenacibaculum finnmarkense TaxID=2781243 RepID=UPI001EFBE413|nr:hypothetical protein [Tenacibaculum finnmarkense]MCG8894599.1 hypothetical protein [Tenacibaculum finnmarkense]